MPEIRDQMARDDATHAIALIESHERVCTERQLHIIRDLKDLKSGMGGLYTRFWVAALSTISMLATACATLIYMVVNKHP